MLNLTISVDGVDDLNRLSAKGVVASLHAIFGDAILPATVRPQIMAAVPEETTEDKYPERYEFARETATASGLGELDKNGTPWDARIHASTKTRNADQSWTRRRNTSDEVFNKVMGELQGQTTVPAPPTAANVPSPPPAAAVAFSTVPAAPPTGSPQTFAQIMTDIINAQRDGKIAPQDVIELLKSIGLNIVTDLNKNPEYIPVFKAMLDGKIKGPGVINLLKSIGLNVITDLTLNPGHLPAFNALLEDHISMQG